MLKGCSRGCQGLSGTNLIFQGILQDLETLENEKETGLGFLESTVLEHDVKTFVWLVRINCQLLFLPACQPASQPVSQPAKSILIVIITMIIIMIITIVSCVYIYIYIYYIMLYIIVIIMIIIMLLIIL